MEFIKSIFNTTEKKKASTLEEDEKNDFTPPFDERRKLSISRSGKMKQAYKKRNILSTELYGQDAFQPVERPKTLEYHVNAFKLADQDTKKSADSKIDQAVVKSEQNNNSKELTPEEQIESAFDVIDKAS